MRILHNAKIYPLTEKDSTASAMLIDQGRILAIGDEAHCLAWGGNPAKEDLGGLLGSSQPLIAVPGRGKAPNSTPLLHVTPSDVLVTGHQAFLTDRALLNIAEVTLQNFSEFEGSGHVATALTHSETRGK